MKKKSVNGYEKPGFLTKLFKKKEKVKPDLYVMGLVPCQVEDNNNQKPEDEENVALEGDVLVPEVPEEVRWMGEVPMQVDEENNK